MWFLLLGACSPTPPPVPASPTLLPLQMGASSSTVVWRALADLTSGTYILPDDNLPPSGLVPATFPLTGPWISAGRISGYQVWKTPLPFHSEAPRPNYAPYDARLYKGDHNYPYVNDIEDVTDGGWLVDNDTVQLLLNKDPNGAEWRLDAPELDRTEHRLNYKLSGLGAPEFVHTEITAGRRTREGLLIPAPGSATFSVAIPPGASLDFGVGMWLQPLGDATSDGAGVEVQVDGEKIWSSRVTSGQEFEDAHVDLQKWAGKTVKLAFVSTPGGNAVRDHVVFTAPVIAAPRDAAPRHVFLVGIDTLRYDALSLNGRESNTSPELDLWAKDALVFDRAYAPAPRTRPSFRTLLTGRYPLAALHAPVLAETLQAAGFRTAGFASNVHLVPRFRFNAGFEEWDYENGARGETQVDRALAWVRAHEKEDTFVFLHLMDPHTFYDAPGLYKNKFITVDKPEDLPDVFNRWEVVGRMRTGRMTEEARTWIRQRYDGEVNYVTDEVTRFFRQVEPMSGRTLEVLVSDHGEEFWDHDGFEHNHSLYNELVHVVMVMKTPGGWAGGPHRNQDPVGLQDIVPTLYDLLEIPKEKWGTLDGMSLRPMLDGGQKEKVQGLSSTLANRPLVQGHLMFDTERWSVISHGWKYILHTTSGREELYDLAADPREKNNQGRREERLAPMREALQAGTGWPVRPGWRIRMSGSHETPFTLHFSTPVEGVGIIDPEASRPIRANLEWGEKPLVPIESVATITFSEDHLRAEITPGPGFENQTVYVRCAPSPTWTCPEGTLEHDGIWRLFGEIKLGRFLIEATPGILLLQQVTEADALAGSVPDSQIEALKSLGYLGGD